MPKKPQRRRRREERGGPRDSQPRDDEGVHHDRAEHAAERIESVDAAQRSLIDFLRGAEREGDSRARRRRGDG